MRPLSQAGRPPEGLGTPRRAPGARYRRLDGPGGPMDAQEGAQAPLMRHDPTGLISLDGRSSQLGVA